MKINIEIYPKEIKKLLELLDLIDKKPEYIYKDSSSKEKEPVSVKKHEAKEPTDSGLVRKVSDMPHESVKYNKKEPLPNKELDQSVQEVVNDLSGKEKLPGASNYDELEKLLNNELTNNWGKWVAEEEELEKFKDQIKQWLKENNNKDESENINDDDLLNIKSNILDDVDKDKLEELIEACKQELEERSNENDKKD